MFSNRKDITKIKHDFLIELCKVLMSNDINDQIDIVVKQKKSIFIKGNKNQPIALSTAEVFKIFKTDGSKDQKKCDTYNIEISCSNRFIKNLNLKEQLILDAAISITKNILKSKYRFLIDSLAIDHIGDLESIIETAYHLAMDDVQIKPPLLESSNNCLISKSFVEDLIPPIQTSIWDKNIPLQFPNAPLPSKITADTIEIIRKIFQENIQNNNNLPTPLQYLIQLTRFFNEKQSYKKILSDYEKIFDSLKKQLKGKASFTNKEELQQITDDLFNKIKNELNKPDEGKNAKKLWELEQITRETNEALQNCTSNLSRDIKELREICSKQFKLPPTKREHLRKLQLCLRELTHLMQSYSLAESLKKTLPAIEDIQFWTNETDAQLEEENKKLKLFDIRNSLYDAKTIAEFHQVISFTLADERGALAGDNIAAIFEQVLEEIDINKIDALIFKMFLFEEKLQDEEVKVESDQRRKILPKKQIEEASNKLGLARSSCRSLYTQLIGLKATQQKVAIEDQYKVEQNKYNLHKKLRVVLKNFQKDLSEGKELLQTKIQQSNKLQAINHHPLSKMINGPKPSFHSLSVDVQTKLDSVTAPLSYEDIDKTLKSFNQLVKNIKSTMEAQRPFLGTFIRWANKVKDKLKKTFGFGKISFYGSLSEKKQQFKSNIKTALEEHQSAKRFYP